MEDSQLWDLELATVYQKYSFAVLQKTSQVLCKTRTNTLLVQNMQNMLEISILTFDCYSLVEFWLDTSVIISSFEPKSGYKEAMDLISIPMNEIAKPLGAKV